MNRSVGPADSVEHFATFPVLVRWEPSSTKDSLVGSGNTDVGNKTLTRKPGQPEHSFGSNQLRIGPSLKTDHQEKASERPAGLCGAMSQQGSEFRGNVSAPQKFVHLVGCRERKVEAGLEARQYSNPVKR
jgi:hypothetical protein